MGQGQDFLVRECFPLFYAIQSPLIFFLRWVRSGGISRFSVRRMVMTPGPGSGLSGPQWRHAAPRGELDTTSNRFPSASLNPSLLSVPRSTPVSSAISYICAHHLISTAWWLWPMGLPLRPLICEWKTQLSLPVVPVHRQSDLLRKHGSGSQRRKLAFRSKYNPPLETSVSAENWTVNLL